MMRATVGLTLLATLVATVAVASSAAARPARVGAPSAAPLPTLGCVTETGFLPAIRPVNCVLESAASYKQLKGAYPHSYQITALEQMKWTSWTASSAHGSGRLAEGMNAFPKISVVLSAPRLGCPPFTSTANYKHAHTFTRLTLHVGTRTVLIQLPSEGCFFPGE